MMGGITSPARPWFRLNTQDQDLAEIGSVKLWLHGVTQRMSSVFLKSNLYNALPITYGDIGVFGTHALGVEEDFEDVVRFMPFPLGSYYLANSQKGKVEVFLREFRMTVRQLVDRFGKVPGENKIDWEPFSNEVKNYYDNNMLETWVDVTHVIRPNPDWDPNKLDSKKFESCYYESGTSEGHARNYLDEYYDKFLSQKGYDIFPVLCPRWETTGEDVYGTECPGMQSLGDIRQLQVQEKRIAQAIEKMVNPPMVGPSALRNQKASILPGDITYLDTREGLQGFRPAHEINFRIGEAEAKQQQIRQRISRAFYEDLFLMLANSDRRDITAREIEERHEEKLLALGPVLEQLNQDLLDPLIDITFDIMLRQGKIPPAPEELQGLPLKVEYTSVMAQAQKLVGLGSLERFAGFVGQMAQFKPDVLDKIDVDQVVDEYGDIVSVPPTVIRSDEAVAEIRMQRNKQQQMQQMAELAKQGAATAKDLSQASVEGDTMLSRLSKAGQGSVGGQGLG